MKNKCCLTSVVLAMLCAVAVYAAFDNAVISLPSMNATVHWQAASPALPDGGSYTPAPGSVVVHVVNVHDGDTFSCDIDGYPEIIGRHIGVRINGIDAPEINDRRPAVRRLAAQARGYSTKRLDEAKTVELRGMERDKYFRILADVYVDGASLGDELVSAGLAKPYDGGTKPKW